MFGADENDGRLYLGVSSPPPLVYGGTEEVALHKRDGSLDPYEMPTRISSSATIY